jgi:Bacterial EndoU nuclease
MNKYFYIIRHLSAEHKDIQDGTRIIEISYGNFIFQPEIGEGPFKSLTELTKSSKIYNSLRESNPKRARIIIKDRFIGKVSKTIAYPNDGSEYLNHIYRIMQHSKNGKVGRKNVLGIHLFDSAKIRIINITKPRNSYGIWEAIIEVYNPNSSKWIRKDNPTTFFPDGWDLQRLINECRKAYDEKVKLTEKKYTGKTISGIPVIFIIENDELSSIYPIYE